MKQATNARPSAAERKAAERERYREAGLVLVQLPIHPSDRDALRRYADRLNRRRK